MLCQHQYPKHMIHLVVKHISQQTVCEATCFLFKAKSDVVKRSASSFGEIDLLEGS